MTVTPWQPVIPEMEALVGNTLDRILADKGCRGHNAPPDHKFRVFISGQKRGVTGIKRQLRRRAAVEPVIGHLKAEHRMGRNYLWFRRGDAANAILAAVGYNFRRLIRWSGFCCARFSSPSWQSFNPLQPESSVLHGRRIIHQVRRPHRVMSITALDHRDTSGRDGGR